MNKGLKKFLLVFALPVVIIILLSLVNILLGLAALIAALIYAYVMGRATLFALLGSIKYQNGDVEKAVKWFRRAYKTGRARTRHVVSFAYLLLKTGEIDEPEAMLIKVIAGKPDKDNEMYAKSNLALVMWKKGDVDGAAAMLEQVIADYKTSAVYGSLGYLLIQKGDLEKALEFNQEAYEYNNSNTVILDNLGQTYYLAGQYDKSQEIYEALISKNPTFPEAYYNYSLLLEKLEQPDRALEMAEKALDYKLSFLSTIKREDVESRIDKLKNN